MPVIASTGHWSSFASLEGRVQQIRAAWARCSETDAEPAGEFGMRRHAMKAGRLLVAHGNEPDAILPPPERLHDAVDARLRQAEDDVDLPFDKCSMRISEAFGIFAPPPGQP